MEPISLLALDDEFSRVSKIHSWHILPGLRDYVYHQVPGSRLACICQGACDRLLCFVRDSQNRGQRQQPLPRPAGLCRPGQRGTTPRGGARRLLNNGLRCGEGVWFGTPNTVGGILGAGIV